MKRELAELGWGRADALGGPACSFPKYSVYGTKQRALGLHPCYTHGYSPKNLSIPCNLPGLVSSSITKRRESLFTLPFGTVKLKGVIIVVIFLNISGFCTDVHLYNENIVYHRLKNEIYQKRIFCAKLEFETNYLSNKHCYWICFVFN